MANIQKDFQVTKQKDSTWHVTVMKKGQALDQYMKGDFDQDRITLRFLIESSDLRTLKIAICDLAANEKARYFNPVLHVVLPKYRNEGPRLYTTTSYDGTITARFLDIVWKHTNEEIATAIAKAEELFASYATSSQVTYDPILTQSHLVQHFATFGERKVRNRKTVS